MFSRLLQAVHATLSLSTLPLHIRVDVRQDIVYMDLEILSDGQLSAPRPWGSLRGDSRRNTLLATTLEKGYFSLHRLPWMSQFLYCYEISVSILFIISAATQLWILRHKKVRVFPSCRMYIQMVNSDPLFRFNAASLDHWIDWYSSSYTWRHLDPKCFSSFRFRLSL